ncbi:nuclear transcription factor Y subunit B [Trichinella spiralis]|uniref:nuclear transcription factor Y subunit B n=1 Tax=Trichinella spiralis TaxID=6334 RepID=UPI0001EFB833|nr:nuclear transcription factor Y subunit B [Trichinella spiralis]
MAAYKSAAVRLLFFRFYYETEAKCCPSLQLVNVSCQSTQLRECFNINDKRHDDVGRGLSRKLAEQERGRFAGRDVNGNAWRPLLWLRSIQATLWNGMKRNNAL